MALEEHPKVKLVGIVHAETSTGALQPLEGLADLAHGRGAMLIVDAVTSLGGHELNVDDWGIDAIYSGTQKCLSCPPGLAPVSFGERALARMDARKTKVQSWYLDVSMLRKYYTGGGGGGRVYHHTAPINMTYALREALAIVLEEGLENRIARRPRGHGPELCAEALPAHLELHQHSCRRG
jgi:alanine-glyoxylate transaminase/serine-glyoxylate transaminase/serine-pyruvate transaminase